MIHCDIIDHDPYFKETKLIDSFSHFIEIYQCDLYNRLPQAMFSPSVPVLVYMYN